MSDTCMMCGNTHIGKCLPDSFRYFQCTNCHGLQQMPFDACFGFENIHCCNHELSAADTWQPISTERYLELEPAELVFHAAVKGMANHYIGIYECDCSALTDDAISLLSKYLSEEYNYVFNEKYLVCNKLK